MKKQLTLAVAIATANMAIADDAFDQFWADTTVDVKARSIYVSMNPSGVNFDTQYDAAMTAAILIANNPGSPTDGPADGTAAGFANAVGGDPTNPADVEAGLNAVEGGFPGTLAAVVAGINAELKTEVEKQGTLNQAGSAVWINMESGYLYDIIGFDLGFQGSTKHFKEDDSDDLILKPGDDGYSRISSARIKARYGDDDVYVKGHYGYNSGFSETDYLMDDATLDYSASGHYYGFALSYSSELASSDETSSEFTDEADPSRSLTLSYSSDYGNASVERSSTDSSHTDTYKAESGVPLSMLGMSVAEDKMMDYLLMGSVSYSQSSDSTNDYEATLALQLDTTLLAGTYFKDSEESNGAYELTAAAELEGITVAVAYNQNSDAGSFIGVADLPSELLINDGNAEMAEQTTISFAAEIDGSLVGVDELSVSFIHMSTSNVNMAAVLAGGDTDYFLTGDASFTETLVDAKYSFGEDSSLNGLSVRTVFGGETNQANVSGYGVFVDYDMSF